MKIKPVICGKCLELYLACSNTTYVLDAIFVAVVILLLLVGGMARMVAKKC